jgi:TRAP-type mannitol/chloroaromatic compound transport system substrate-binding protein
MKRRQFLRAAGLAAAADASLKAAFELYAETSKTNADFKKVLDAMLAFRNDEYLWWQVAELSYDTYLVRNRTRV